MSCGELNLQRFSIIINAPSTMTWTPSQLSTTTLLLPCKLWPSTWVLHVCFRLHAALRSQFSQTNFVRRMHDERANSKSNRIHVTCSVTKNSWACKSSSAFVCWADKVDDLPQKFKQNLLFLLFVPVSLVAQEKEKIGSTWKINIADNARTKKRCNKVMMTSVQTANWSLFFFCTDNITTRMSDERLKIFSTTRTPLYVTRLHISIIKNWYVFPRGLSSHIAVCGCCTHEIFDDDRLSASVKSPLRLAESCSSQPDRQTLTGKSEKLLKLHFIALARRGEMTMRR